MSVIQELSELLQKGRAKNVKKLVQQALDEGVDAKEILEEKGVNIRVVALHTIKPIDVDTIVKCARETKKLISIEDHNIIGGLGGAISEVLTDNPFFYWMVTQFL